PEHAQPTATTPGELLEANVSPGRDILQEARELGRPVLIVRLGERRADPAELVWGSVAGTILYPDQKVLPPPAAPPCVPHTCFPYWDPALGKLAGGEECVRDGGDRGVRAGIGRDGQLRRVDPEDTVGEY